MRIETRLGFSVLNTLGVENKSEKHTPISNFIFKCFKSKQISQNIEVGIRCHKSYSV